MRIEDLKWWHWAIVGVVLGLGLSYWRGSVDAEQALAGRSTLDTREFERLLTREPNDGEPSIRDIRVYPTDGGVYWVSAEQRIREGWRGNRRNTYIPVKVRTTTPYVPKTNPPANTDPDYTVIDYLHDLKEKNANVGFTMRWWDEEPMRSAIWAGAGLLLVGGVWPSVIRLMIRKGYGHRTEKKGSDEYDLSRFGKGEPEPPPPAKTEPSEAELAKLRALEAELERSLASGIGIENPAAPTAPAAPAPSKTEEPVRKLTGGPVELVVEDKPKEEKHYAGEYYPTVTHVKKS